MTLKISASGPDHDPLHGSFLAAVECGDADAVARVLMEGKVDINYQEPKAGLTALHIAAGRNAIPVLKLLVATGRCDFTIKDGRGRTAADVAVTVARNLPLARYLYEKQFPDERTERPGTSTAARPA